jgi:hypothetical protein
MGLRRCTPPRRCEVARLRCCSIGLALWRAILMVRCSQDPHDLMQFVLHCVIRSCGPRMLPAVLVTGLTPSSIASVCVARHRATSRTRLARDHRESRRGHIHRPRCSGPGSPWRLGTSRTTLIRTVLVSSHFRGSTLPGMERRCSRRFPSRQLSKPDLAR